MPGWPELEAQLIENVIFRLLGPCPVQQSGGKRLDDIMAEMQEAVKLRDLE